MGYLWQTDELICYDVINPTQYVFHEDKQASGDDMNYIISGTGRAICDGIEEALRPEVMNICPKGSEHAIINTGEEDLVMLTIVVKK